MKTISVITPSLNSGAFIAEAITSVIEQTFPALEHIIVDGGSTDETGAIVARFGERVRVERLPGSGQAEAVNFGVARARGDVIAILNADDWYYPNAFASAIAAFESAPNADVVYGRAYHVNEDGAMNEPYPTVPFDRAELQRRCIICQPAAFVRRDAFCSVGGMDERTRFALDYELWMRMAKTSHFHMFEEYVAVSRMHRANKTLSGRNAVYREAIAAVQRHYRYVPYTWIIGYAQQLVDGGDQYYDVRGPSISAVALSFMLGCAINVRDIATFVREWWSYRRAARGLAR